MTTTLPRMRRQLAELVARLHRRQKSGAVVPHERVALHALAIGPRLVGHRHRARVPLAVDEAQLGRVPDAAGLHRRDHVVRRRPSPARRRRAPRRRRLMPARSARAIPAAPTSRLRAAERARARATSPIHGGASANAGDVDEQHHEDQPELLHAYPWVRNQRTAFSIVASSGVERQAQLAPRLGIVEEVRVRRVARRLEGGQRAACPSPPPPSPSVHPMTRPRATGMRRSGILMPATRDIVLVEVAHHDVVVAEDVALADAPLLGGEHVPLGAVVDVDGAEAARRRSPASASGARSTMMPPVGVGPMSRSPNGNAGLTTTSGSPSAREAQRIALAQPLRADVRVAVVPIERRERVSSRRRACRLSRAPDGGDRADV